MPSRLLAKSAEVPPGRLFWTVVLVVVAGQLLAFWMLCSHQVRKAEVREATLQVQRVAVADCLQYIPHATLHGCAARVDPAAHDDGAVLVGGEPTMLAARSGPVGAGGTTRPVNFAYP